MFDLGVGVKVTFVCIKFITLLDFSKIGVYFDALVVGATLGL